MLSGYHIQLVILEKFKSMIFLDNNSTTPLDKRVKAVMEECLTNNFGNPHSAFHQYGTKASLSIQKSRKVVADFLELKVIL